MNLTLSVDLPLYSSVESPVNSFWPGGPVKVGKELELELKELELEMLI